jgi:hypothetical protein
VICAFVARWRTGEPEMTDELDDFAWVSAADVGSYRTTPELPRLIARAIETERSLP